MKILMVQGLVLGYIENISSNRNARLFTLHNIALRRGARSATYNNYVCNPSALGT